MNQELWTEVEEYITGLFVPPDPALEAALESSRMAGLPEIQVTPGFGQLLAILTRAIGARSILEIGTLAGYSAIWMGRALPPGGRLITLEANPKHAEIARNNLTRAGLSEVVEIRFGAALESLAQLAAESHAPFDLVFIDADKPGYPAYFDWALKLTHRGSLIIADNVVRKGAVTDPASADQNVQGVRRFNERVSTEPRVTVTELQTVGKKGYDGFAIAIVG